MFMGMARQIPGCRIKNNNWRLELFWMHEKEIVLFRCNETICINWPVADLHSFAFIFVENSLIIRNVVAHISPYTKISMTL